MYINLKTRSYYSMSISSISIDDIIVENTDGEPGMYLSKYGVFVFSVTLGGNVLLIDTAGLRKKGKMVRLIFHCVLFHLVDM